MAKGGATRNITYCSQAGFVTSLGKQMEHANGKTNTPGNAADSRGSASSVLPMRLGSRLVRSLLYAEASRCRSILGSLWKWFDHRQTPGLDDPVAHGHGRSIQRAGTHVCTRCGRILGVGLPQQRERRSFGCNQSGLDRMHHGVAQQSVRDRNGQVCNGTNEALVSSDGREPVFAAVDQRRANEHRCFQPGCVRADGRAVWVQAFVALLSRYIVSRNYAAHQRCSFRTKDYGPSVRGHYRTLLAKAGAAAVLPAAFVTTGANALRLMERIPAHGWAFCIGQWREPRTRAVARRRGSAAARTAKLDGVACASAEEPP